MPIVLSTSDSAKLEPKRKNRWVVSFDAVPGGGKSESLSFCAHTGTKPQITFDTVEEARLNEKWKFAGKPTWNTLSYNFYDFIAPTGGQSSFTIMNGWWRTIYEPTTGQMGYAIEYKTHGTVAMLDPKGNVVQTWHIFYAYPSDINYGDISYEDSGIAEVMVVLTYDYAIPGDEVGPTLGNIASGEQYPKVI